MAMYRTLFFLFLLFSVQLVLAQDDVKYIKLLKEKAPLRMLSYHLTGVKDDRTDSSKVGIIHTGLSGKKNTALKLYPGVQQAIHNYIQANYKQDTSTTAFELHIIKMDVTHSRAAFSHHLEVAFGVAFYIDGEKITDYEGSGGSDGSGDPSKPVEEMIRKNLNNALEKFDVWWQKNKAAYLATKGAPTTIVVEPVIATSASNANMVVYSPNRLLRYEDFEGEPDNLSRAVAATYSGIQLRLSALTKDATVKVRVEIVPYTDKSNSWFRKTSRTARTLLHEQKHFDITALKACDLLQLIKTYTFTADYANELDALHSKNDKEWDAMQRSYDKETNHGQISAAQQKWNKAMEEKLSQCPCYK